MRDFRLGRNTTEHYSSFEECAKAWNCRPVKKKTDDEKKLAKQQEKFANSHRCKACGNPMGWVEGTSTMVCANEKCRGIKQVRTDKEGNEIVTYLPSYDLLDNKGFEICNNLFS